TASCAPCSATTPGTSTSSTPTGTRAVTGRGSARKTPRRTRRLSWGNGGNRDEGPPPDAEPPRLRAGVRAARRHGRGRAGALPQPPELRAAAPGRPARGGGAAGARPGRQPRRAGRARAAEEEGGQVMTKNEKLQSIAKEVLSACDNVSAEEFGQLYLRVTAGLSRVEQLALAEILKSP